MASDLNLSKNEKKVLIALYDANKEGAGRQDDDTIAAKVNLSAAEVRAAAKFLLQAGLIDWRPSR